MPILSLAAFMLGLALVVGTLLSAVRTFVLPRSINDRVTRTVFFATRTVFNVCLLTTRSFARREGIMAFYAPISLLVLPGVWLTLILLGYSGMYWALGIQPWTMAVTFSGSSLLTLGFAPMRGMQTTILAFTEAAIGLVLVALLIAYLPTIYQAFARREAAVTMLEVRAGSPPSAVEMIVRYQRIHGLERLHDVWTTWESWFVELEESHTSLAVLAFFRSPQPHRSWITAAGAVLDCASLVTSTVDIPKDVQAELCIRAGFLALRHIADFFDIPYDAEPLPDDPISVTRAEFDEACERLAREGIPLKPDREQSWQDFAGWRVNYDTVLLDLANLTMAPSAPWSSDRSQHRARLHFKLRGSWNGK